MRQPVEDMAFHAAQMLIDLRGAPAEDGGMVRKLDFEIVVRESAGPPRTGA